MNNQYYVYIVANKKNGTLYTGMTNNLIRRIYEHRTEMKPCFTQRYRTKRLVYFETFNNIYDAIQREKKIKKWNRQWKINLIEKNNKSWKDLYPGLIGEIR